MATGVRAVLFDLDDTLFDRRRAQGEVLALIVQQCPGLFGGIGQEALAGAFHESDQMSVGDFEAGEAAHTARVGRARTFLRLLGLDEGRAADIAAAYVRLHGTIHVPVPGAEEVVTRLSERLPLGLISNGFPDVQHLKLAGLGLTDRFACLTISGEVGIWKPAPEIFLRTAAAMGERPPDCLYVGDSYAADVVGAKAAGMQVCWFNPLGQPPPQTDPTPDHEIAELTELLAILGPGQA